MSYEKIITNYKIQFTELLNKLNEFISISRHDKNIDRKQLRIDKRDYKKELKYILNELSNMGVTLTEYELNNGFNIEELLNE